jgi:hypothetical protein
MLCIGALAFWLPEYLEKELHMKQDAANLGIFNIIVTTKKLNYY